MKLLRKPALVGVLLSSCAFLGASVQSAQAAPTVKQVSPSQLRSTIAQNKGKVVLVNFWATWCSPCATELPELAKLKRANASKGLVVLLVSGDEAESGAQIKKVLAAKGHAGTYQMQGDFVDWVGKFDPGYKGQVAFPRTYIYNRQGQRVKIILSDHTQAQWQSIIKPYL